MKREARTRMTEVTGWWIAIGMIVFGLALWGGVTVWEWRRRQRLGTPEPVSATWRSKHLDDANGDG